MTPNTPAPPPTPPDDDALATQILTLQKRIEAWVRRHGLWHDCGFKSYLDHFDAPPWPDHPVVTVFHSDGDFNRIFDGTDGSEELYEGFSSLLKQHGYYLERDTGLVYVYVSEPTLNSYFRDFLHWQWICNLIQPDFTDIHHEVFQPLSTSPRSSPETNRMEFSSSNIRNAPQPRLPRRT